MVFCNGLEFGSQLQEGMISRPYAHACLAPGEAQAGRLGDENVDISFNFKAFREHVTETKKTITCVVFGGLRRVRMDESS